MTDRELAECALSEVLALLEKATPGPWTWASNGNIVPMPYKDVEVAAVYSEHEDDTLMPANAKAIINAVAFLRQHGPALLAALSTPSSERDAEFLRGVIDSGRAMQSELLARAEAAERDAARYRFIAADHGSAWEEELDAAIAAAAGGGK